MESGKLYSLVEIFGQNKRIVIPDLQRDYCWGTVNELAEKFTQSLIDLFEGGKGCVRQCSLGLIYAYENPPGFVNIADGQQRLTTIYLLLCVLYRRLDTDVMKKEVATFLSLDSRKNVREPRLRYEVRESTLYFMKDFLNKVIFGADGDLGKLEKSAWFRKEYEHDPSIESMVAAISKMDSALNSLIADQVDSFALFLLGISPAQTIESRTAIAGSAEHDAVSLSRLFAGYSGICFVYFDVQNREFGEQMYVIINTRGAPMEMNEHIKPLLLCKLTAEEQTKWTEKWESWQDYFWAHRKQKKHGASTDEESGDEGFNEFLTWFVKIETKKAEKTDSYVYFSNLNSKSPRDSLNALKELFDQRVVLSRYFSCSDFAAIFSQINEGALTPRDLNDTQIEYVIIPLLAFMVKYPNQKDFHYYEYLRLLRRNWFDYLWKNSDKQPTTRSASRSMKNILDLISESIDPNHFISKWIDKDEDEQWKRSQTREKIIALENHKAFGGRLDLIRELVDQNKIQLDTVHKIIVAENLFGQGNLLRRALLCFGNYFPNTGTACKDDEWHLLVFHPEKSVVLKNLIIELATSELNDLNAIIEQKKEYLSDELCPFQPLILYPDLFDECKYQRINSSLLPNRISLTSNQSNFTRERTWFISQHRIDLYEKLLEKNASWNLYCVKSERERLATKDCVDDFCEEWVTVGKTIFDKNAMIAITSNGLSLELGIRKGPECDKTDKEVKEIIDKITSPKQSESNKWESNEWWYVVKTIYKMLPFDELEKEPYYEDFTTLIKEIGYEHI